MEPSLGSAVPGKTAQKTPIVIEVCVDSVESALAAVNGGADRLEICANLGLGGGTTPSAGLVKMIKEACPEGISLMAMVRPRTGDFLYSEREIEVMLADIPIFKELGISGIVIGALCPDGSIDTATTQTLVDAALHHGLQVCYHRAFDMVKDQETALQALLTVKGLSRILTSGGGPSAPSSIAALVRLCKALKPPSPYPTAFGSPLPLDLMPGSGISAQTAGPLLRTLLPLGVRSVHLSGACWADSGMVHRPAGMGMGVSGPGEWGIWRTDERAVQAVREAVNSEWEEYIKGVGNS